MSIGARLFWFIAETAVRAAVPLGVAGYIFLQAARGFVGSWRRT